MFEIGEKVVCVDDSPSAIDGIKYLQRGDIYVILVCEWVSNSGYTGYAVVVTGQTMTHLGWRAYRFRKLTDMQEEARQRIKKKHPA
jgi:hypothetical protein